jgi:hypothetical protein
MAITTQIRDRLYREAPELENLKRQAEGISAGYPNIGNGHEGQILDESMEEVHRRAGIAILKLLSNAAG